MCTRNMCICTFLFLINSPRPNCRSRFNCLSEDIAVPNVVTLPKRDSQRLDNMQAQLCACLALSRATLEALAALSPLLARTAAETLGDEARAATSREARRIINEIQHDLSRPASERAI